MRLLRYLLPLLLATSAQAAGSLISTAFQGFQTPTTVDLFNRANGGLGANWTNTFSNVLQIVSDTVQQSATYGTGRAIYSTGIYSSNQYAQVQIVSQATAGCVNGVHVLFTTAGSGIDTFYGISTASAAGSSATLKLSKAIGGTVTTLATYTVNLALGDSIGVSAVNGTVTGYHNGKALGSVADSSITTGNPGIEVDIPSGGAVTDCSLDNFVAGNVNISQTGTTLLAYINSLGFTSGGAMFGSFLNPFSATPLDAINTTTTTFGTLTQACGYGSGSVCGANAGALPGLLGIFAACSGNITSPTAIGGGGCNIEASNSAPNDWLSLAQAAQAAGYIVNIIWAPNNPAGSGGTPWPNVITNNGNSTYTTYIGWLTQLATDLKTLTKPFIFSPAGELNIACGTAGACLTYASYSNWEEINAQSTGVPTSAQNATLFQLQVTTLESLGVKNMLVNFETNFGQGNNCYGWPGTGYVDLVSADTQPATFNNSSDYGTLTGSGNCGNGYPFWMGSLASSSDPGSQAANSVNTYTSVNQEMTSGTYTGIKMIELWGQGSALPQQTGAAQALTTSPWINKSSLPASFSKAGGIAGG